MSAANVALLQAAYSNLVQAYANAEAQGVGPGQTIAVNYSLDGESYQWQGTLDAAVTRMRALKIQIQLEGGPFMVRSRGVT
jgi:hypothetical protein